MHKKLLSVTVLLGLLVSLVACGGGEPPATPEGEATPPAAGTP